MDEKKFTPEEIAKSLRACDGACRFPCSGCAITPGEGATCWRYLNDLAAELIEGQAKRIAELEEQNRWISVEERLPELEDGPVLVNGELTAVEALVMIEGAERVACLYFDGYDFFDIQGYELIPYRASHRKPMPEGPEVRHE